MVYDEIHAKFSPFGPVLALPTDIPIADLSGADLGHKVIDLHLQTAVADKLPPGIEEITFSVFYDIPSLAQLRDRNGRYNVTVRVVDTPVGFFFEFNDEQLRGLPQFLRERGALERSITLSERHYLNPKSVVQVAFYGWLPEK